MRLLKTDDEALFCGLYTDADTMRFIGEPLTPERAARSFRKVLGLMYKQPAEWLSLVIIEKATQQPVGICGVANFDAASRQLEVGMMFQSEARSRGFAKEGLAALVRKLFSALSVCEIWVEYSREHSAAAGLVRSIGFSPRAKTATEVESRKKCIWHARRETWCSLGGDADGKRRNHVECDSLSGADGAQCQPASFDKTCSVQNSQ
jgi:RimJ/RimL family protein N-acetyltransferase